MILIVGKFITSSREGVVRNKNNNNNNNNNKKKQQKINKKTETITRL